MARSPREPVRATPTGWRPLTGPSGEEPPIRLPESPFGRLALTHAVSAAGDTLVTLALAGSLFFSISPEAAKGKVLLYLLLTLAPFVVVSPFLGPLIDRFATGQRWIVVLSAWGRAVVCVFMARDLNGLLLFPEAFTVLVLSKTYAVARSSLVPAVVPRDDELVRANSRLSLISGIMGFLAAIPGGITIKLFGSSAVLWLAGLVFIGAGTAAIRLRYERPVRRTVGTVGTDGVAGHGSGPATPLPAGSDGPGTPGTAGTLGRGARSWRRPRTAALRARREAKLAHLRDVGIRLAAFAMAVIRGLAGFLTFLVAFAFRRASAPTWWFGAVLAASVVGSLLGAVLAPKIRQALSEEKMLIGALGIVAAVAAGCSISPTRGAAAVVAAAVGFAGSAGRLAFDSLVQRDGDRAVRGTSFARFETRFQLVWVLGALAPVVIAIPRRGGFIVMALVAAGTIVVYLGGEEALERLTGSVRRAVEKRPIRDDADEPDILRP